MTAPTTYCDECGAANPLQAIRCFACNAVLQSSPALSLTPQRKLPANAAVLLRDTLSGPLPASYLLHARYSIVKQIGTGGFGAVYQAKDTLFSNRLVAIKEMNQDGLSGQELAEATSAFEREALLLSGLAHPNLPRIHDHFSEHGRSYVVMDFIPGDTLEDYLETVVGRVPVEAALDIGIQLCSVLDYLHSHQPPIIFRDLKPANIMRTADNHVYLIDFGIARHFKPGQAKDTVPLGSKGYAAPEQYGKAQTTPQSDIYSLGATLHQLITGDDPSLSLFHFESLKTSKADKLFITPELDALLARMLAMEMGKRPANMAVVKQELQRLRARQALYKPGSTIPRRGFMKGCLSVVATCGAGIALTTYVVEHPNVIDLLLAHPFTGTGPAHTPAAPKPAQATTVSQSLYTYHGHAGSVTAVAWSPRGDYIASSATFDGIIRIWNASTGDPLLIPVANDPHAYVLFTASGPRVDALAWSPEGTRIAAAFSNDLVGVLSITTGKSGLIPFTRPQDSTQVKHFKNALAWSPDGKRIAAAAAARAGLVQVRSTSTENLLSTYAGPAQAVFTLAWSPDGKRIAAGIADGMVQIWEASGGRALVTYHGHTAEVTAVTWSPDSTYIASGSADATVQVWNAATGQTLFTYRGHSGAVNSVAWQPGSRLAAGQYARIVSGGDDSTAQVWSLGQIDGSNPVQFISLQGETLIYRGHSAPVLAVAWSPDGQKVASSSEDGTVQVWRAI